MVKRDAIAGAILAALAPAAAGTRGAVTMENDVCKMQIGRMFMHFRSFAGTASTARVTAAASCRRRPKATASVRTVQASFAIRMKP
jgi:hypothetical protein